MSLQPAKIKHLNCRVEKQGKKEFVPAADIRFQFTTHLAVLDAFSPALKDALFENDMVGPVPRASDLVYPLELAGEMNECTVVVDSGVTEGGQMSFIDAKVNSFKITPLKGGTIEVSCRVQCRPTQDQIGRLYVLQEKVADLSFQPAEAREPAAKGKGGRRAGSKDAGAGAAAGSGATLQ